MNHAYQAGSHQDVRTSSPTLLPRLFTVVKGFFYSPSEAPIHIGSAFEKPPPGYLWLVSATLTRQASFGTVSAQSSQRIRAETKTEALDEALSRLAESHTDFNVAMISAAPITEE